MIRKGKQEDLQHLITITQACANYLISKNIFQWNAHYPNIKAFEGDLKREELYVLVDPISEEIIGCITISILKDSEYEAVNWLTEDRLNYYLHRLAIHPDFQHQGNAKILMDFAEDFTKAQQAISIRLDTFSLNTRNQKFYKNRGYKRLTNIYFPKQSEAPFYCYELVL